MKKVWILVLLIIVMVATTGCESTEETQDYLMGFGGLGHFYKDMANCAFLLESYGLFGEHPLERLGSDGGSLRGSISGSLFSLHGKIEERQGIRFVWRYNNSLVISSLPIEGVVISENLNKKVPTIRFKWQINAVLNAVGKKIPENPNVLVSPEMLVLARIEISPEDLRNEIYLALF